ncbi:MAG: tyrosine--tRNA ligase [Candidatus Levybacteria bacterium CG10_big_fil_rev_8_21_14_0_10_36_7]|nr:MAG: tyrosine--tRNA ligase [Candidatus Levybacteria bacterium CG10_big_fil_rev_8_21_14_0_10_36_7]
MADVDKIEELLTRGVANIIPSKNELKKELSQRKLNIYLGIDPTAPKIHLGHAVSLIKLQRFAELGHNVTLLIGDFTALVGDTSDKESERPVLTEKEIEENFKTYKDQAKKILDFSTIKIKRNSEWLSKLTYAQVFKLKQQFSLNDFISRELIKKRLAEGKHIRLDETEYPIMQGYDSYFMDTDLQIGGTDQTFNMQTGRILQKKLRNKESFVLTTEFLMGTDGRKMSKSWGNAIWLNDKPSDMYGKIMSIKDDLILQYFTLATEIAHEELEKIKNELSKNKNPMDIKKGLAFKIVKKLHNENEALKAQEAFEKTVQKKELPENILDVKMSIDQHLTASEILVKTNLATSNSEAKRLVDQGAMSVNGEIIQNPNQEIIPEDNMVIKAGKRNFVKIKVS